MRVYRNVVLLLLLLLAGLASLAGATPLLLSEAPVHVLDRGELSLLQDPGRQMTLDDVRSAQAQGRFRPLDGNLGLGYIPEAAWLHLDLRVDGASPVRRWLEVLPPYLDDIQLFHLDPSGKLDHRVGGDLLPQSAKEEPYRAHLFKLDLAPASTRYSSACKPPAPCPPLSSSGSPTLSSGNCAAITSSTGCISA